MRIIVCIKQICHTYARTGSNPDKHYLADRDHIYCLNPPDEAAFELALQLKETNDNCNIIILTMGPLIAEKELRRCFALGGDHLVQIITDDESEQPTPRQKSILFAKAVTKLKADIVLCGKESVDRRNGLVGAFLAHCLQLPFLSAIDQLTINKHDFSAQIVRKTGQGKKEKWHCCLPAVFSVDNCAKRLHFPTLTNQQYAADYPIETLSYSNQQLDSGINQTQTIYPLPRTKNIQAPDSKLPAFDRMRDLFSDKLIEKKRVMIDSSNEVQVEAIITFLKNKGFLKHKNAGE